MFLSKLELHDVKLAQVEGQWIIASAVLDCDETLGDGSTERMRWSVSRSELHPNPDSAALHAFEMDAIPDGTPVRVVDVQAGTQRQGVWRKGKVD